MEEEEEKKLVFIQYREKVTENFESALNPINAPLKGNGGLEKK